MTKLYVGELAILSGDQKRCLECFVDVRHFNQRKNFDEYTMDVSDVEAAVGLVELMILADEFKVEVLENSVQLTDRE